MPELNDGTTLPDIGFGTYPLRGEEGTAAVLSALEAGYRLIDTAVNYQNEDAVGRAIAETSVPRDEIIVATKVPLPVSVWPQTRPCVEEETTGPRGAVTSTPNVNQGEAGPVRDPSLLVTLNSYT